MLCGKRLLQTRTFNFLRSAIPVSRMLEVVTWCPMHAYHAIGDLILRIFTCTYSVTREWVMECDEMSYGDYAIGALRPWQCLYPWSFAHTWWYQHTVNTVSLDHCYICYALGCPHDIIVADDITVISVYSWD